MNGRVEDHAHVLKNCFFSPFVLATARRAFGLAQMGGRQIEPSRLLLDEPDISMQRPHNRGQSNACPDDPTQSVGPGTC